MHIDPNQTLSTESDVEQKVIMPLLTGPAYLGIPQTSVFTKQYLEPTLIDKASGKNRGYYPDYSVWLHGFPVMIVEAKSPDVEAEVGYREASLYARHLNQTYPTKVNPCASILACNGVDLLFGFWDSNPTINVKVADLLPNTVNLLNLQNACDFTVLSRYAQDCLNLLRQRDAFYPYLIAGGIALLNAKLPVNGFAAPLSPILRRYF